MGSDQHFCLRWNNFHSNIAASFEHLRDHEEFVDVTLACEGRSLKAHKIVLSACSPYFKNLLKQNPCQHPIIILRDVAFPDLSALLSFVYQGEVYVSQDRLPAFLRTAEMLHIKGLTEQNQNHHSHTTGQGLPVTIGPLSTTVLQATHDQGILSNKLSSVVGLGPTSPPSPSAHLHHLPLHISPPPKKRRSATTITAAALPSGSPTAAATSSAVPTSSTPPHLEAFPLDSHSGGGNTMTLEGSTLAAALTKPLQPAAVTSRTELVVTQSRSNVPPTPLPPHPSSAPPVPPQPPDVPKVKQEAQDIDDIKEEEGVLSATEEAVNLVTEGSILRQRIQGLRGSPDAPLPPQQQLGTSLQYHEDSSTEEGFTGMDTGGELGLEGSDQDKEAMAGSPMVIRSPLVGLLPREAPGLFGGAGTSGSLSHHESSQGVAKQE
ncbi:Broad-complex core protein isoforms 1/2/3/4/5, partial [Armadillidium vulgare]